MALGPDGRAAEGFVVEREGDRVLAVRLEFARPVDQRALEGDELRRIFGVGDAREAEEAQQRHVGESC